LETASLNEAELAQYCRQKDLYVEPVGAWSNACKYRPDYPYKGFLSLEETRDLKTRHKQSRDKRECDRIKAILLFADGWSIDMISQALLKHPSSIIRHLNDYTASKKITSNNGGSASSLTSEQTKQAIKHYCGLMNLYTNKSRITHI